MRKLYEDQNVPIKVINATVPFPEEVSEVRFGMALEFRWAWGAYCCRDDH